MRSLNASIIVVVALILLVFQSVFIVDEREKVLVLQFGRVVAMKEDPGIKLKIPFIQSTVTYDDRILSRDIDPLEVTPLDDRRLVVDAFARYRIIDVVKFREATGADGDQSISVAGARLDRILSSQTREILGSVSSNDILSSDRAALMLRIRAGAISEAQKMGIEIVDVRLKRTDLPRQNLMRPLPECGPSGNVKPPTRSHAGTKKRKRYVPRQTGRKLRSFQKQNARAKSFAVKQMLSETQFSRRPLVQIQNSLNSTDHSRPIGIL